MSGVARGCRDGEVEMDDRLDFGNTGEVGRDVFLECMAVDEPDALALLPASTALAARAAEVASAAAIAAFFRASSFKLPRLELFRLRMRTDPVSSFGGGATPANVAMPFRLERFEPTSPPPSMLMLERFEPE